MLQNNREVYRQLMYTLGIFPDTSRFDRDQFVTFVEENVVPEETDNFIPFYEAHSINEHTAFDYGSISITKPVGVWSSYYFEFVFHVIYMYIFVIFRLFLQTFSIEEKPAYIPKDTLYKHTMGSSFFPSFLDFKQLNDQYCSSTFGLLEYSFV